MAGIVKFGVQQNRGDAGQSSFGPKRGYNFANLRAMNQAGDQVDRQAAGFQQKANSINQGVSDSIGAAKRVNGNTDQVKNLMAQNVERAKGLSNQASGFSPANQMMKTGVNPYQAGIGSFYAGGKNSTGATKIRQFGGLYQSILQRQAGAAADMNKGINPSTIGPPQQPPQSKYDKEEAATDKHNIDDSLEHGRGPQGEQVNRISNLDWLLKTGRITNEQYYAAQDDDALYDSIVKSNGNGSSNGIATDKDRLNAVGKGI